MNGLVTYSRIRFIISMSSTFQNCNCSGSNYNTLSHWWLKIEWTTIYSWMGLVKGLLNRVLPELRCGWFGPGTGHTGHYHDFCNCFRVRCHQARELPLQLEPWTIDQKNLYIYIGSLLTYSDTPYSFLETNLLFIERKKWTLPFFHNFFHTVSRVSQECPKDKRYGWVTECTWLDPMMWGFSRVTGNGTCNSAAKLLNGDSVPLVRMIHLAPSSTKSRMPKKHQ